MMVEYDEGDRYYELLQFLDNSYGYDTDPYDSVDEPMRAWVAPLHGKWLHDLRLDIEHFRSAVPTARERRWFFDLQLPFDDDGEDLDALLVLTHRTVCDQQRRQQADALSVLP